MARIFLFVTILFFYTNSIAQSGSRQHNFVCSYYGDPLHAHTVMGFASTADAKTVISRILSVVGLEPRFEIRSANIPNAAAVVSSGKRYIFIQPSIYRRYRQGDRK